jgi:hypothetical protein
VNRNPVRFPFRFREARDGTGAQRRSALRGAPEFGAAA